MCGTSAGSSPPTALQEEWVVLLGLTEEGSGPQRQSVRAPEDPCLVKNKTQTLDPAV